jgi:hypothetical protein
MSYDRQIDQICPHIVVQEPLFLAADRMTIYPIRPIASIASIVIRLDGCTTVPPMGVSLPAQAVGSLDGPFTITSGVNDTLVVVVNQGSPQTIVVPAAVQTSAQHVAYYLNVALGPQGGISFSAAPNSNRVAFMTTTEGANTSVFFTSASTICPTIGFNTNRQFQGQNFVPGWTVISDPAALATQPNKLIVFDYPLLSGTEFVEINYSTTSQMCRRCGGTGVEFDWRIGAQGNVITVSDEALLIQELEKDFFTTLGSNQFHNWYGTQLLEQVGAKLTTGSFVQNLIVQDVYQAFSRWQQIKQQQQDKVGQVVTDAEFPYRLLSVALQQSNQDPTVVFVNITVQNRSTQPIQISRGIKIPQPTDLLGATQQQGFIRQSLSNYVLAQ